MAEDDGPRDVPNGEDSRGAASSAGSDASPAHARLTVTNPGGEGDSRTRLVSLDVFRGITVAAMLLVNNPGSWSHVFPPLRHAEWHGWTPTDLIFPFFLFIVGVTTFLSLSARRTRGDDDAKLIGQIFRRGGLIVLLGLALNAFPFYTWSAIEGLAEPSFLQRVGDRFQNLRFTGVLQRIGVVYIFAALLTLRTSVRTQVMIITAILGGYWMVMTLIPVPGSDLPGYSVLDRPAETLAAWSDRALLGPHHIWKSAKTWDPEGPLSTVPAIATAMLGILCGRWLSTGRDLRERIQGLYVAGCLACVAGLVWNWSFPINKNLWTSSYVVFTAGMACLMLASCIWIVDALKVRRGTFFFVAFGLNPMVAFVGSGIMTRMISSLIKVDYGGKNVSVQAAVFKEWFSSWLPSTLASLCFAIAYVLVWWAILELMRRRNFMAKV